jgi:hypothetical protein
MLGSLLPSRCAMPEQAGVSRHYTHGKLIDAISGGIVALGKTIDTVSVDDLAPVDEFHIGGRRASEEFLDQLGLSAQMHVLDIGCGLGGAARLMRVYSCVRRSPIAVRVGEAAAAEGLIGALKWP